MVLGANTQPIRRILGFLSFSLAAFIRVLFMPHPDVVIASVPPAPTAASAFMASRLRRCKFVVILRDIEPLRALAQRGRANGIAGRTLIRIFMWIYRRAVRVVVVHPSEGGILASYGIDRGRISVIPHGVELSELSETEGKDHALPLPRGAGRLIAAYVGTIGLVHGLDVLLESIAHVRIRELPIDFVIVGDGQYFSRCRNIVITRGLSNVRMLGAVLPEAAEVMMRQADILICSYRNQDGVPLGSKFYEYCATGRPILVHGRNRAAELLQEIGNGMACDAGDVDSLHFALSDFIRRSEHWRAMGQKGRCFAKNHFLQNERDEQWSRLLSEVVQSGHE
jgi:colanic acid biosynthesis glycosyl transferase WcaI